MAVKQYRNRQDEESEPWTWGALDKDLFDLFKTMIRRGMWQYEGKHAKASIATRKKYYGEGYEQYVPGEKLND